MSNKKIAELFTVNSRISYIIDIIKDKRKLTQKKIAQTLGISSPSLTKLRQGGSKQPAGSTLMMFKEKFGVNPDWLINGKGEPFEIESKQESISDLIEKDKKIKEEDAPNDTKKRIENIEKIVSMVTEKMQIYSNFQIDVERLINEKEERLKEKDQRLADKDKLIENLENQLNELKKEIDRVKKKQA
jgi:transcriptional regulator with XRE-family HTH domain